MYSPTLAEVGKVGNIQFTPFWYTRLMDVAFSNAAGAVQEEFYARPGVEYDRLWDVLDRILLDVEEAKHAPWVSYVSTFDLWGAKIPGTDYTVFWRASETTLLVAEIVRDV